MPESMTAPCPVEGCDWPDGRWGPKYDCGLRRMRTLGAVIPESRARELGCGYARAGER